MAGRFSRIAMLSGTSIAKSAWSEQAVAEKGSELPMSARSLTFATALGSLQKTSR
ncbi:hypothetical protein [Streptomyces sp. NPDC014685]|uniref:hypothetical protein n=1 Tax=Streptomyces sp. NPDC014685 TaxID=3364881 RepID=UPI0036FF0E3D